MVAGEGFYGTIAERIKGIINSEETVPNIIQGSTAMVARLNNDYRLMNQPTFLLPRHPCQ